MIIADTNLVAYLLIEGDHTAAARKAWQRDSEWLFPPLWRSEFLSVLTTSVNRGVLTKEQAYQAWRIAIDLFGKSEQEIEGEAVLHCALSNGISAYDAHFVVLAEHLGIPLVTSDRKLAKACHDLVIPLETYVV